MFLHVSFRILPISFSLAFGCVSIHHGDIIDFPQQALRISCFESNDLNQSRMTSVSCVFENQSATELSLEFKSVRSMHADSGYLLPLNQEETTAAVTVSLNAAGVATTTQTAVGVTAAGSALQPKNQGGTAAAGGAAVLLSEKNEANRIEILKNGYGAENLMHGKITIEAGKHLIRRTLFPYDMSSKSSRQIELCIKDLQPECSQFELNKAASLRQRG